jgi:hypothetical protein
MAAPIVDLPADRAVTLFKDLLAGNDVGLLGFAIFICMCGHAGSTFTRIART